MFAKAAVMTLVGTLFCCAAPAADNGRQYVASSMPGGTAPAPPFSNGVMVGSTFYVAGHIGLDPATGKAAASPETEAHLMLDGVTATLAKAGLSMDDLVSVTVYCTDLALYDTFNAVYRGYVHEPFPARAFIGVASLVRGAHFEIAGVAVASGKRHQG